MFDSCFRVNTHPPTTVKQRERLLYALGAGGADGAFRRCFRAGAGAGSADSAGPDLVEHLRGRGGGTAPQPRQAGHAQLCVDIQQLIQPGRARRHKKRCQPVVGLRPCPVASSGDPPGQCVHRRTNDPFIAKPVACELEQHTGRVMLQRPSEQERVELLAIAGARRSPAQPGEHERPVITPGATFPAPIGGQPAHVLGREPQQTGKPIDRG